MPEIGSVYAREDNVAARSALKRKAFFIDEQSLQRAKKALGVRNGCRCGARLIEWVTEMEEFWRFMRRTRGKLGRGALREP